MLLLYLQNIMRQGRKRTSKRQARLEKELAEERKRESKEKKLED